MPTTLSCALFIWGGEEISYYFILEDLFSRLLFLSIVIGFCSFVCLWSDTSTIISL